MANEWQDSQEIDAFLVKQVQEGNKDAYNLLVVRHQYKVCNIISRYIQDATEVNDIAQEAFLRAYRAIDKFRGDSAFYTWLYRIAVNTAKNYLIQQSKTAVETYELADMELKMHHLNHVEHVTPEALLQKDELQVQLKDLIHHLPDDLRTTLLLREIDGLSYDEIAEVMLCPIGTVRSRIHRARETIEKGLGASAILGNHHARR